MFEHVLVVNEPAVTVVFNFVILEHLLVYKRRHVLVSTVLLYHPVLLVVYLTELHVVRLPLEAKFDLDAISLIVGKGVEDLKVDSKRAEDVRDHRDA